MKNFFLLVACLSINSLLAQVSLNANIPSSLSAGSSTDVEVKIQKGTISSFAKYQMDLPEGFSVSLNDSKGGNFTFDQQRAKIVWVSVPNDAEYSIVFKIQVSSNAPSPSTISQKFFYLENGEKKEFEAEPINVTISGGAPEVVSNTQNNQSTNSNSSSNVETVASTPVETVKPTSVETVASTPVETVKSTPVETVKSTPVETVKSTPAETVKPKSTEATKPTASASSEEGLTFSIQLGAFSSEPSKSKFNAAGAIRVDFLNGLYKVTSGNFNSREDALKHMDKLSSKGYSGLFIAKYKNGKRIN